MEIMSRQMFSPFFENGVCLLFRIVEDIGVASVGMSITQIAIERSCATLFRTKYENMNVAVGRFIAMQSVREYCFSRVYFYLRVYFTFYFQSSQKNITCFREFYVTITCNFSSWEPSFIPCLPFRMTFMAALLC